MDKKAMVKAYKDTRRPMGVFRIKDAQNNKIYVDFGTNMEARMNRHRAELKFGSHKNRELQETWDSFGESALDFEVLDILEQDEDSQTNPAEELQVLADMWIRKLEEEGYSIMIL
jgi:hypothetical protein